MGQDSASVLFCTSETGVTLDCHQVSLVKPHKTKKDWLYSGVKTLYVTYIECLGRDQRS